MKERAQRIGAHLEIHSTPGKGTTVRVNAEVHATNGDVLRELAVAGQGIIQETLNMAQTRGYYTGGTIHLVVNNQIGFTTAPTEGRSTRYCTDVAKMIEVPIFHVNGEDPESVVYVGELALDFRETFGMDVVIDMVCYRRYGHNEGDEPSYTQPLMYAKIKAHPSAASLYGDKLVREAVLTRDELERLWAAKKAEMSAEGAPSSAPFNTIARREPQPPPAVDPPAMRARLRAVLEALFGVKSEFVRTPKYRVETTDDESWKVKRIRNSVDKQSD